ncbi:MAG: hypothetical protein ACK5N9_03960, partial [Pirellula sp.]
MVIRKFLGDPAIQLLSIAKKLICLGCILSASPIVLNAQDSLSESIIESGSEDSLAAVVTPTANVPRDPLAYANERVKVKASIAGVAQASGVTGSWWNLSETFAPSANYEPDRAWGELWIRPGVTTDFNFSDSIQLYSGLSYVGSGNIGRDVFEQGNRGLYAIEDGYLGVRMGDREQ